MRSHGRSSDGGRRERGCAKAISNFSSCNYPHVKMWHFAKCWPKDAAGTDMMFVIFLKKILTAKRTK